MATAPATRISATEAKRRQLEQFTVQAAKTEVRINDILIHMEILSNVVF